MRRLYFVIFASVVALTVICARTGASGAGPSAYQRMIAKLHSLKTYRATIQGVLTIEQGGGVPPRTFSTVDTVLYKKPNKLSLKAEGMMGGLQVVSNGSTVYQYVPLTNQYTEKPAPANLLDAILLNASAGNRFKQVGGSNVNGIPVTILKGTSSTPQGPVQTTIYIDQKDDLPYRIVVRMANLTVPQGGSFHMTSEQTFSSQKVNTPLPDSAFHFVPPASATKVSSLGALGNTGGGLPGFP